VGDPLIYVAARHCDATTGVSYHAFDALRDGHRFEPA
jgi:hypothetical protein